MFVSSYNQRSILDTVSLLFYRSEQKETTITAYDSMPLKLKFRANSETVTLQARIVTPFSSYMLVF